MDPNIATAVAAMVTLLQQVLREQQDTNRMLWVSLTPEQREEYRRTQR